ncbi:MAG: hypothetical protein ACQSGP_01870 [Frankia sp.]
MKFVADGAKVLVVASATSLVAGGCALGVIVFAVVDPAPGAHTRGLLIALAVVALLGVGTAWVRVASTLAGRSPGGTATGRDGRRPAWNGGGWLARAVGRFVDGRRASGG